jgi:DNA-binding phage protein/predicted RNA-binding protein
MNKLASKLVRGDVVAITPTSQDKVAAIHVLGKHTSRPGEIEVTFGSGKVRTYPQDEIIELVDMTMSHASRVLRQQEFRAQITREVMKDLLRKSKNQNKSELVRDSGMARQTVYDALSETSEGAAQAVLDDDKNLIGYVRPVVVNKNRTSWFAGRFDNDCEWYGSETGAYESRKYAEAWVKENSVYSS